MKYTRLFMPMILLAGYIAGLLALIFKGQIFLLLGTIIAHIFGNFYIKYMEKNFFSEDENAIAEKPKENFKTTFNIYPNGTNSSRSSKCSKKRT